MNDELDSRRQHSNSRSGHASHSSRTSHSNPVGKWMAGAAVAAVLAGGGYYAWKNSTSQPVAENVAEDSSSFADASAFSDSAPIGEVTGNAAPVEEASGTVEKNFAASTPTESRKTTTARAAPKQATVAAAEIPEETIGVSQVSSIASQSDEVIVNAPRRPVWRSTPSATRLSTYYPAGALERGREGEASLRCTVEERGALDCVRVSETPARAGFGNAALRVARSFRHAEQRADGQAAIGTQLNLRVLFRVPDDERRG